MRRLSLAIAAALACAAPSPRADEWRIVGPGGGGSIFHPTISPHDSRTALVSCDMTVAYLTHDCGATWRIVNLGDTVQFFVFDPIDPRVIYAKALGVFRSADSGQTWARFFPREVRKITMGDDHASGRILTAGQPSGDVTAMAIDPAGSRSLYLALGSARGSALWISFDAGGAWQKAADLPGRARQIWIDERSLKSDRTLYVAGPDALYIRREGRWRTTQLPGTATEISGAPPVFYATVAGKIYVSTDGSVTWRDSPLPGFQGQATAIAAGADHPEIAYVSYSGLRATIASMWRATWGVAKTTDAGRHWEPVYDNVRDAWLTERFGAGWAGNPIGLGIAPHDAGLVDATDSGRVMRTTDGGKTWNYAYANRTPDGNWTTNGIDVTTCYGVHFDPFDARHMFIGYTDIGLWASDTAGASWYSATRAGVPHQWE